MKTATAIVGNPVSHSLSPLIHQHWMSKYGIAGSYERIEIARENFASEFPLLKNKNLRGVNITVPFKESVLPFIDEMSESAAVMGAVNTVVFDKKTSGYNTDAEGFRLMLADGGWAGSGRRLVMLGAGGAARAVLHALKDSFEQIIIINRDISRAEKLSPSAIIKNWAEAPEFLHDCDLLVNTTSLGMKGQPELELDISNLPTAAFVADIIYVPEKTKLLKQAEARGNRIIGGLGMLLHQAAAAFEIWHGIRPEIDGVLVGKLAEELKTR